MATHIFIILEIFAPKLKEKAESKPRASYKQAASLAKAALLTKASHKLLFSPVKDLVVDS
jgi:hypothetical protein